MRIYPCMKTNGASRTVASDYPWSTSAVSLCADGTASLIRHAEERGGLRLNRTDFLNCQNSSRGPNDFLGEIADTYTLPRLSQKPAAFKPDRSRINLPQALQNILLKFIKYMCLADTPFEAILPPG
jgi:hypothetical protein